MQIIVSEIPFQVNKARLIEKMAMLVKEKRVEGISTIRDESNKEGIRVVIELKKDAIPAPAGLYLSFIVSEYSL